MDKQTRRDHYDDETFWRLQIDDNQLSQERLHRFWYMPERPASDRELDWADDLRDMVKAAVGCIVVGALIVLAVGFLINK